MKWVLSTLCILILTIQQGQGQTAFTAGDLSVNYDFTGFTGSGFQSSPTAGQLNSNNWIASGFTDGDLGYGDSGTTGDFARGISAGGVGTGGIYSFDVDNGGGVNRALGVQPSGFFGINDFESGFAELRLQNNTGSTIGSLDIAYDIYANNNGSTSFFGFLFNASSGSLNFSYFIGSGSETLVSSLDYASGGTADTNGWVQNIRSTTLSDVNLADGEFVRLRWTGDAISGIGARDEFAIDNIAIDAEVIPEPSTYAIILGAFALGLVVLKRRYLDKKESGIRGRV